MSIGEVHGIVDWGIQAQLFFRRQDDLALINCTDLLGSLLGVGHCIVSRPAKSPYSGEPANATYQERYSWENGISKVRARSGNGLRRHCMLSHA